MSMSSEWRGSSSKVSGTSKAIATVAVSPGMTPTRRPASTPTMIQNRLAGVRTSPMTAAKSTRRTPPAAGLH
ncbi:hypothetical protein [Ornithinimicrobium kibberense]|uniref:hypothetical protein n=1 Tax=Ornithinimicrobium kibberense TaxID=282060 RepID=UPI003609B2CF